MTCKFNEIPERFKPGDKIYYATSRMAVTVGRNWVRYHEVRYIGIDSNGHYVFRTRKRGDTHLKYWEITQMSHIDVFSTKEEAVQRMIEIYEAGSYIIKDPGGFLGMLKNRYPEKLIL